VPDPPAALAAPTGGISRGSVNLGGDKTQTINPGIYTQIGVSGNAHLTLNPGVYILAGGGLTVSDNAGVSGSGVMLYNTGSAFPNPGGTYGGITLGGSGTVNLTAPTSGPYAGGVLFQDRTNTRTIAVSGNAAAGLDGTVYAPAALLSLGGNAALAGAVVVNELALTGNATSTRADAAGQVPAGNREVDVGDANGLFTAEDLSRIQAAVNAVVEHGGLGVAEITGPNLANLVSGTGSSHADGNLGPSTSSGANALAQTWNRDGDPPQRGTNHTDSQPTGTDGPGESADPASALSDALAPVIRASAGR
jgi:hypothetical protein